MPLVRFFFLLAPILGCYLLYLLGRICAWLADRLAWEPRTWPARWRAWRVWEHSSSAVEDVESDYGGVSGPGGASPRELGWTSAL